ncbi:methyl-accepting chemotaxis protein [Acetobacterium sp. KB-1]|jgi:methyl-accepting chemotaxis protein|uniref:methyl-accepting chemotaxis protein n=1 Tax=Acetobacterium sp. KB-1 TaxID=2184575 RepID=UPI000DBEBF7E|nr:methyl-accepting chemotaxis protein [Acetobacterium sp. KB-1]AWW26285.1 hypothetical protein DOZ58_06175 [Acetobacterium sp. KB-1]
MEKKLATPPSAKRESISFESAAASDEMERKRELARRQAKDKVRARTLAKQQQLAERIAVATEQMASGIEEASSAAEELAATMAQISSGATEAASAAEESRAAINQVEKASVLSDGRAKESFERAEVAKDLISNISGDIELMIEGIKESAETNSESVKLIGELERQSNEVGEIVQAVVRIADQTNLLALNAAIEAARAGEHGKGFAVVADEVRNLAETSEKSATNIRTLVNEIQSNVKVVVLDIENAGKVANSEVEKAAKTSEDLIKINDGVVIAMAAITEVSQNAVTANKGARNFWPLRKPLRQLQKSKAVPLKKLRKPFKCRPKPLMS